MKLHLLITLVRSSECFRFIEFLRTCIMASHNTASGYTPPIFCVLYRPQSPKMKQFLSDLENLLIFLRSLNDDSMIFGHFDIDTIVESKEMKDYENLLTAFDYRKKNILPDRVTPTSATCLDHVITSFSVSTETLNTSFSDYYTVLGEIKVLKKQRKVLLQNFGVKLRNKKREKALNFCFFETRSSKRSRKNVN